MFDRLGDTISQETIAEKVSQFIKYGNVFLLFEVMSLRKEIERIRDDIESIRNIVETSNLKTFL